MATPTDSLQSLVPTSPSFTPGIPESTGLSVTPTIISDTPIPTPTPSSTPTDLPTTTPISTPSSTPSSTPISTPSSTPISTPSSTPPVTPSFTPSTTLLTTSFVTVPPSTTPTFTVTFLTTVPPESLPTTTPSATSSAITSSTSTPGQLQNDSNNTSAGSGGLSTAGITAIAVVIPVVVVAALVLLLIWWLRKRKQRKAAEEARRKEVEEYGYNPNTDPTLPAVGAASNGPDSPPAMSEDAGGYRGWGGAATTVAGSTARKPSTNLSSGAGMAASDDGFARTSPDAGMHDGPMGGPSSDPLVDGAGPGAAIIGGAGVGSAAAGGIRRGPSNASSSYSAAGPADGSDDGAAPAEYGYDTNYSQYTPYRPGAAGYEDQPVIRDVSARRQTKLENPGVYPQQGNSTGIAQNF